MKEDINNKQVRLSIIEKYLEASTSAKEELALAEYYRTHHVDEDEIAYARLILADLLPLETEPVRKRALKVLPVWAYGLAAVMALAVAIVLFPVFQKPSRYEVEHGAISSVEIAEAINELMSIETSAIELITAKPQGGNVMIAVEFENGCVKYYLLARDARNGGPQITAFKTNQ